LFVVESYATLPAVSSNLSRAVGAGRRSVLVDPVSDVLLDPALFVAMSL